MSALSRARILKSERPEFDVMEAFLDLDSARKMALFDRLSDSRQTFYKTVTLFWPHAGMDDAKKLERFLVQGIAANDS